MIAFRKPAIENGLAILRTPRRDQVGPEAGVLFALTVNFQSFFPVQRSFLEAPARLSSSVSSVKIKSKAHTS